ncbi:unnamed protein product [Closterium sp. NIES-54]
MHFNRFPPLFLITSSPFLFPCPSLLPLLYSELSLFIASGRLNCKIDKVAGVLETNRPDARNAQYQSVLKQGDLLLNRIQKLSRVIDV